MRKFVLCTLLGVVSFYSFAQDTTIKVSKSTARKATIKWAPASLATGSISIQGEYMIGRKSSLTAKFGIPFSKEHAFEYDGNDVNYKLNGTSFMAGYRMYLSKKQLRGLYFEPYVKYLHHTAEGLGSGTLAARKVDMKFENDYKGLGIGAQLGVQFLISNRIAIDWYFLGPEINSSNNLFTTREVSNAIPWTFVEAEEAEQDVKDFIDDIPYIRNKTKVTVDKNAKTVKADFKGALPGFRTGISIGIAL